MSLRPSSGQARSLPEHPSLEALKKQAKALLKSRRQQDPDARVGLQDCQHALAQDYGFKSWAALKEHVLGKVGGRRFLHVHSGDSACVIPPYLIDSETQAKIAEQTKMLATELNVIGLMNVQYAIHKDTVYILEANPRASRTVPLVSKVCNIPMARIATQIMLGKKLSELGLKRKSIPHFGVKEAVFPFSMYHGVDPLLGPEMRSTGVVLGMAESFGLAFYRAQQGAQSRLPSEGTVLISVADADKPAVVEVARRFAELGFRIKATEGTRRCLAAAGIEAEAETELDQ